MSPKRRYQTSSIDIGLGTQAATVVVPPPTNHHPTTPSQTEVFYGSSPHNSYNRPITPAEIAVNPCLTYRGLAPRSAAPQREAENSLSPSRHPHPQIQRSGSGTKGNRTYRVRYHHQNHYGLHVDSTSPPGTAPHHSSSATHQGAPSLSQGIFGLPVIHDYLRNYQPHNDLDLDELGGHKLQDSSQDMIFSGSTPKYTDTRPRMKSTLPSSHRPVTPTPTIPEDMEGVLQVRPASRSRTRPEQNNSNQAPPKKGGSGGARRRVQSSGSHNFHSAHNLGSGHSHGSHAHPQPTRSSTVPQDPDRSEASPEVVDTMLQEALNHLKSQDWEQICDAFHKIQHLTSEFPSQVKSVLKKIIWNGLPHVASSRTKVSRSACQCFKKLYETQRRSMEGEGDKVFQRLLDLSGGPHNKFIQDECKEALLAAVKNTDALKSLSLIEQFGSKHRNGNVREFAACLLADIMDRLPGSRVMSKDYAQKIMPLIVGFLREGQLNTRLNAKECLGKIIDHPEFELKLRRFVSPENIRHVNDTIRKFRVRRS